MQDAQALPLAQDMGRAMGFSTLLPPLLLLLLVGTVLA
jgi:hypothetical protein